MSHDHTHKKEGSSSKSKPSGKGITSGIPKTLGLMVGPAIGIFIGAIAGMYLNPSDKVVTGLKALAAGVVLGAVSTELIPKVAEAELTAERRWIMFGIFFGASVMVGLRTIFGKYDATKHNGKVPIEMIVSIGVDFFVDAMLIGMAMSLGEGIEGNIAIVMTIALGLEMALVTLAAAGEMEQAGVQKKYIYIIAAVLCVTIVIGGIVGNIAAKLLKDKPIFMGIIAFAVAALIWLVTEELLHSTNKSGIDVRLSATLIFIGFAGIIGSGWLGHAH